MRGQRRVCDSRVARRRRRQAGAAPMQGPSLHFICLRPAGIAHCRQDGAPDDPFTDGDENPPTL